MKRSAPSDTLNNSAMPADFTRGLPLRSSLIYAETILTAAMASNEKLTDSAIMNYSKHRIRRCQEDVKMLADRVELQAKTEASRIRAIEAAVELRNVVNQIIEDLNKDRGVELDLEPLPSYAAAVQGMIEKSTTAATRLHDELEIVHSGYKL